MKNGKSAQKSLLLIIFLMGFFSFIVFWYKQTDSIKTAQNVDFIADGANRSLLIATQSSPFKDSIIAVVSEHYKLGSVAVEVVDAKTLINMKVSDFDAILLMYRWEANAPPFPVQLFMEENSAIKNKMVVLSTSWNGLEKVENIDALTSASDIKDVTVLSEKIINSLNKILKGKG